jgi:hypothetical protein
MSSNPGSKSGGVLPPGDALQKAVRWLSNRRRDDPTATLAKLIDEACLRFDLTPVQAQGLYRTMLGK